MSTETYDNLPPRLQLFAALVAGGETQAGAVRIVRPECRRAKQQGSKWAKLPRVKAAIAELKANSRAAFESRELRHKTGIYNRANADRSLVAAAILFGAEAVGLPKDPREWPQELKDCIEGVEHTRYGPKVLLSDRNTASRLFSQHMGWMTERHELTGKDGGPVQYEDVRDRNLRTLEQISARLSGSTAGEAAGRGAPAGNTGDASG